MALTPTPTLAQVDYLGPKIIKIIETKHN
jgi:hypothetical protein